MMKSFGGEEEEEDEDEKVEAIGNSLLQFFFSDKEGIEASFQYKERN